VDLRLSPCEVRIGLAVDDVGTTTVGLDWADGAALGDRATCTQRVGKRREQGLANLGWDAAIELYRPILSYEELSGSSIPRRPGRQHSEYRMDRTQQHLSPPCV
jgi:hypothetical protein